MIGVHLLATRRSALTALASFANGLSCNAVFFSLPVLLALPRGVPANVAQSVHFGFGADTRQVSLYLAPGTLVQFLAGVAAGYLGARFGSKWSFAAGMCLQAAGAGSLALLHATPSDVVAGVVVVGIGFGFASASLPRLVADGAHPTETGVATGLNAFVGATGATVAAQTVAFLLSTRTIPHTDIASEHGFVLVLWVAMCVAFAGATVAALISSRVVYPVPQPAPAS